MTTKTGEYSYHCFRRTDCQDYLEARFWNQDGKQLAIVAIVTRQVDWAAYIGTDAPNSYCEKDTLIEVAKSGCKLSREDALHFFPEIKLPYRE